MGEKIISARIDDELHNKMKQHDEINWSAIVRKALINKLKIIEIDSFTINKKRAEEAMSMSDEIRKSKIFDKGKSSTEIIREWRDKRK